MSRHRPPRRPSFWRHRKYTVALAVVVLLIVLVYVLGAVLLFTTDPGFGRR